MTSSAEFADLNRSFSGRTVCPLSLVVIALIFSELRGGGGILNPPLPSQKTQKKRRGFNYETLMSHAYPPTPLVPGWMFHVH